MSKYSVKKPFTVLVAVVMLLVLGIVSFTKMTTGSVAEYFPPVHTCDHNLSGRITRKSGK